MSTPLGGPDIGNRLILYTKAYSVSRSLRLGTAKINLPVLTRHQPESCWSYRYDAAKSVATQGGETRWREESTRNIENRHIDVNGRDTAILRKMQVIRLGISFREAQESPQ
jgi:hypothetical protein